MLEKMMFSGITDSMTDVVMLRKKQTMGGGFVLTNQLQQTLLKWCNFHLKRKGFYIDKYLELQDGICVIVLLEILTGNNLFDGIDGASTGSGEKTSTVVQRNWKIIHKYFQDESMETFYELQGKYYLQ